MAKEKGVGSKLKAVIKRHREEVRRSERLAANSPEAQQAQAKREKAKARREAREAEQLETERKQHVAARSAALALILSRFSDDLPALVALATDAGSRSVFSYMAERELLTLLQQKMRPVEEEAVIAVNEPGLSDVETVNLLAMSEADSPASSTSTNTADEERGAGTIPDEPAVTELAPTVPNATPQLSAGKFGDLSSVVSTFPAARREQRLKFGQSRGRA